MVHKVNTMHGVAFDAGQVLSNAERTKLRNVASTPGLWTYVEPET